VADAADMPTDPADQLREALLRAAMLRLKADSGDSFAWLDTVARVVVEIGGGDAVDLLHMKLDDALEDHDQAGDPDEN